METRVEDGRSIPAPAPDDTAGAGLRLLAKALQAVQAAPEAGIGSPPTTPTPPAAPPAQATFMVEHAGHIVARGTVTVGSGRLTNGMVPRLEPGAYTLTLMAGHGPENHVLLRESITLPAVKR